MLAQIITPLTPYLLAGFGLTWILLLAVFLKQRRDTRVLREALRGSGGERLEPLLMDHLRSKIELQSSYDRLSARVDDLELWSRDAVAHVGFVRYDAFGDMGGHQSFALALQNAHGDGVIITSILGREQIRVYGKSINGGRCDHGLTPEEQEALRLAANHASKAPA